MSALLVMTAATMACNQGAKPTQPKDPATLALRLVLSEAKPPCTKNALPQLRDAKTIACFRLEPATVTAGEVSSARIGSVEPTTVVVKLNSEGARKFSELTSQHIGERIAIVSHGVVLSAPTVQTPIVDGALEVSGLSDAIGRRLVKELGGDPFDVPPL